MNYILQNMNTNRDKMKGEFKAHNINELKENILKIINKHGLEYEFKYVIILNFDHTNNRIKYRIELYGFHRLFKFDNTYHYILHNNKIITP